MSPIQDGENTLSEVTLRNYVRVLFRQKSVITAVLLTTGGLLLWGLLFKTPVYEARVKMLISAEKQVVSPYFRDVAGDNKIEQSLTQGSIVVSAPVLERAVHALALDRRTDDYEARYASGLKKWVISLQTSANDARPDTLSPEAERSIAFRKAVDDLRERIKVIPIRNTNLFSISVEDFDPVQAAALANVVSRSYVIFDLEQQLAELNLKYGDRHPLILQLKDSIAYISKSLNGGRISNIDAMGPASVKIIEQASIPEDPSGAPRKITLVLGLFMGLFLGITFAFVSEYMDPTFKAPDEIERGLDLPILGSAPRRRRGQILLTAADREKASVASRFYQVLCDQIFLLVKAKALKSIALTSACSKEGVSSVTANLGLFLSERTGSRVLIVDANFREPALHKILKIDNKAGLSDVLEGKLALKDALKERSKGLSVLTAGASSLNPAILLSSDKAKEVFEEAARSFDIVLVDSPNLLQHKDTLNLVPYTRAVVLVISEARTRRHIVNVALQSLLNLKVNILGVVINNRTFPIPGFLYHRV